MIAAPPMAVCQPTVSPANNTPNSTATNGVTNGSHHAGHLVVQDERKKKANKQNPTVNSP